LSGKRPLRPEGRTTTAWSDSVQIYCERLGPGLIAEPANALSNLAFFVAAAALWRLQSTLVARGRVLPADLRLLAPLVLLVAIGSTLFHTLAVRWAGMLDSLFILLFCCVFLYGFLRHAVLAPVWAAIIAATAFAVFSYAFPRLFAPGTLNASTAYLPNLVALVAMTAWLGWRQAAATRAFALASAVFCMSLTLRTIDQSICVRFPLGTHFLWHLLNGLLLWIVGREMLLGRYAAPHPSANREALR
jgi:hypothetical protein